LAKPKTKMLAVFDPAVDDFCYLIAQSTVAMFNAETKADSPDSAQPNPSEDGKPSDSPSPS